MIDFDRLMNDPTSRPDDLRAAAAALVERAAELEGGAAPSPALLLTGITDLLDAYGQITIRMVEDYALAAAYPQVTIRVDDDEEAPELAPVVDLAPIVRRLVRRAL